MTEHIRNIRPARAAIAAVLALSTTPVLAQVAAPPTVAPTIAPDMPAPTAAAPMVPAFAVGQPVVQQTLSVEERRAAAIAAAEAEAATKATTPVAPSIARPRTVERMATPVATGAAPVAASPVAPAPAVASEPVAGPAPVMAQVAPAPVTGAVARTDDALLWAMGGSALLLLGLGGAAMARRRRPAEAVEERDTFIEPVTMPVAVPVARPAFATASSAPYEDATLAAMVAALPSEDNPFLTHAKRLRRARVLLAQREAANAPVMTQAQSQAQVATPAPAMDRSQTVYRFGGEAARPGLLRPRTS